MKNGGHIAKQGLTKADPTSDMTTTAETSSRPLQEQITEVLLWFEGMTRLISRGASSRLMRAPPGAVELDLSL